MDNGPGSMHRYCCHNCSTCCNLNRDPDRAKGWASKETTALTLQTGDNIGATCPRVTPHSHSLHQQIYVTIKCSFPVLGSTANPGQT